MIGRPLLSPSTTIFVLGLLDSSWATSMAFHFRSSALIPARRSPGSRRCPGPPRACVPLPAAQEQDLLGLDSARREGGAYVLEHALRDELARTRVEELRLGLRGDVADDRAQLRIDDHAFEVAADRPVDPRGGLGLEPEQQRDVEADVDAGGEDPIRDAAEEVLHTDVAGGNDSRRQVDEEPGDQETHTPRATANYLGRNRRWRIRAGSSERQCIARTKGART